MDPQISGLTPWRRVRRIIRVPAPAVGTDWIVTVPSGKWWDVLSVHAELVTGAGGGVRTAALSADDGHGVYVLALPAATQAAALTRQYDWFPASSGVAFGTGISQPIPSLHLAPGWSLSTATDTLQAVDQWGDISISVIETTNLPGDDDIRPVPELYVVVVS